MSMHRPSAPQSEDWQVEDEQFEDEQFEDGEAEDERAPQRTPFGQTTPSPEHALAALPLPERTRVIDAHVYRELARLLRIPPQEVRTSGRSMSGLGVGSVTALRLQNRIAARLGVRVELGTLLLAGNARDVVRRLAEQVGAGDSPAPRGPRSARPAGRRTP